LTIEVGRDKFSSFKVSHLRGNELELCSVGLLKTKSVAYSLLCRGLQNASQFGEGQVRLIVVDTGQSGAILVRVVTIVPAITIILAEGWQVAKEV